jgi:hypothetical protein
LYEGLAHVPPSQRFSIELVAVSLLVETDHKPVAPRQRAIKRPNRHAAKRHAVETIARNGRIAKPPPMTIAFETGMMSPALRCRRRCLDQPSSCLFFSHTKTAPDQEAGGQPEPPPRGQSVCLSINLNLSTRRTTHRRPKLVTPPDAIPAA